MPLPQDPIACSLPVVYMRKGTTLLARKVGLDSWPSQHFVDPV